MIALTDAIVVVAELEMAAEPEQCEAAIVALVDLIGAGYHPDTPAAEYVWKDGRRFDADDARHIDRVHEVAYELLDDPCAVALEAFRARGWAP